MAPFNGAAVKEVAKRSSPLKNRLSVKDIKSQKKRYPPGWYVRSILLDGNMEIIYITQGDLINDAYYQPLVIAIGNDSDASIDGLNLLGCFRLHRSLSDDSQLIGKSGYARKVFVRVLEEDQTSPQSRKAGLLVIKAFLERPENNRYDTKVYVPESWDLTPSRPTPLRKLDYYLKYEETVKIIRSLFAGVDHQWATENPISANTFFTSGYIRYQASTDLGFPEDVVVPIGVRPPYPVQKEQGTKLSVDCKETKDDGKMNNNKEDNDSDMKDTENNEQILTQKIKQESEDEDAEREEEGFVNTDGEEEYEDAIEDHVQQDSEGENSDGMEEGDVEDSDGNDDESDKKPAARSLRSKNRR